MTSALIIQAVLMIVLVVASMLSRRAMWSRSHVWLIVVGMTGVAIYLAFNAKVIERWWAGWLTIAMILKNVSLTILLAEAFMKQTPKVVVCVPIASELSNGGRDFADVVESVRSSSRLAASLRADSAAQTSNGKNT